MSIDNNELKEILKKLEYGFKEAGKEVEFTPVDLCSKCKDALVPIDLDLQKEPVCIDCMGSGWENYKFGEENLN